MRVLIADDDAQVRSALKLLLEQQPDTALVAETGCAYEVVALAASTVPDVILLDWQLPGGDSAELVQSLRRTRPGVTVIALSARPECEKAARSCCIIGFISKNDSPEVLLNLLDRLAGDLNSITA